MVAMLCEKMPVRPEPTRQENEAFKALIETQLEVLYSVAVRYMRDRVLAQDLVHDTVVRALRFQVRFEPGTNFKAWMLTILTNTFIHRYRRQKREREILEGVTRAEVERNLRSQSAYDAARAPEQTFVERLLSDDVIRALAQLPEDFRMVVVLCDLEGLSYRDIAEILECPVGTVMSRLYRARRLLEKELEPLARASGILRLPSPSAEQSACQAAVWARTRVKAQGGFSLGA